VTSLELRQLEYFVSVAEHLHFGRAAEALAIGQPAVSQQIARLERMLGTELLDRSPRNVRLTEAGARFLPRARAVLAAVDRARESVADDPGVTPLRLGTSSGMGDRLDVVLGELARRRPTRPVELTSVTTQARLERVAAGQLDVAFVRGVTSAPGVEVVEVWEDPLVAVLPAGHELAALERVPFAELARLPVRLVPRRTNPVLVDLVLRHCAEAGRQPLRLEYDGGPVDTLLAAVANGAPSWTVLYASHARMIQSRRVAFRPTDPGLSLTTGLAVPATATSQDVAPLVDACLVAAALPPAAGQQ
jgi:DNA-binding transcriptional LysR family regulator